MTLVNLGLNRVQSCGKKTVMPGSNSADDDVRTTFRQGMRSLCGAVTIVATGNGRERSGLTATAVCSVSVNPARLLACVNVQGSTFNLMTVTRRMTVNVLARSQEDVARRFAEMTGAAKVDPFETGSWRESQLGSPLLDGALVSFDCIVNEMLITHTHSILIGDVRDVIIGPTNPPLLYNNGTFISASS